MAIRDFTVKDRILLHLFDFQRFLEEYEVPFAVTQSGIAEATGIRVQHSTQYLKPLLSEELVEERQSHIQGKPRRRKVYFLTPQGRAQAVGLRRSLFEQPVPLRRRTGQVEDLPLARVYQEERRGTRLLELLQELAQTGAVAEAVDTALEVPQLVDFTEEAPSADVFYGREEEVSRVLDGLQEAPVVVVTGLPGIGKSTLGAKVYETLRGSQSVLWAMVRPWDSPTDLGLRLGLFLQALGKPRLYQYLAGGGSTELNRVEEILRGDLLGDPALLVFDDMHNASQDLLNFFSMLHGVLKNQKDGARTLLLSRHPLGFYGLAAARPNASVREIQLGGLGEADSLRFLVDRGTSEEIASALVRASGGNPLFLRLLARSSEAGRTEGAQGSIEALIATEIEPSLDEGEREIMQLGSLYAVPVPSRALLLGDSAEGRHVVALEGKGLLDRLLDDRLVLHDSLRGYFTLSLPFDRRTHLASMAASWLMTESERLIDEGPIENTIPFVENAVAIEPDETRQAARLQELGDRRRAVADWAGALDTYRIAIDKSQDVRMKAFLHARVALTLNSLWRLDEVDLEIKRGLALLPPGPSIEAAWLLIVDAANREWIGQLDEAFRILEEVGRWIPTLPRDSSLLYWWTWAMVIARLVIPSQRDFTEALRLAQESVQIQEGGGLTRFESQSLGVIAWLQFLQGQLGESLAYIERWEAEMRGPRERGNLLCLKAYVLSEGLGEFEQAETLLNEALHWLKVTNQEFRWRWIPHMFADLYQRQGRPEDARESLDFFLANGEEVLEPDDLIEGHTLMARLCVECSSVDEAQEHLSIAEDLLTKNPSAVSEFDVARARGVLLGQLGRMEEAETNFNKALDMEPPPFRGVVFQKPLATECSPAELLLDYGRFLSSAEENDKAADVLTTALEEARKGSRIPLQAAVERELGSL